MRIALTLERGVKADANPGTDNVAYVEPSEIGEAANALGVAESTVSWRMHEAKRRLSTRTLKEVPDGL